MIETTVQPPRPMQQPQSFHWRNVIAAPHRIFFFGGTWALVLSIVWWGAVLLSRYSASPAPAMTIAPQWVHGWLMICGSFIFFAYGFLMTALPRWLGANPIRKPVYVAIATGLMAGYILALLGGLWSTPVAIVGMALTFLAWLAGVAVLAGLFVNSFSDNKTQPAWAVGVIGVGGLIALMAAIGTGTGHWSLLAQAPRIGAWAFLAPLVFVIVHRIVPFFAKAGLGQQYYRIVRPRWTPPVVVLLLWAHAVLLANGLTQWLFVTDIPLLLLTAWHLVLWQFWKSRHLPLLWSLFVGFAWLPIALALSTIQSLALMLAGQHILGLAPLHAVAIGMAASMVFAMATRVTMGHSGRPLKMERFAVVCFLILQAAAICRICAEIHPGGEIRGPLLVLSAILWLCTFVPWAGRFTWIYWRPRLDGRPG